MSSRHLKKVFGTQQNEELQMLENDDEGVEDDEPINSRNISNNFALLNQFSDGPNDENDKEEDPIESDVSDTVNKNELMNGDGDGDGGSEGKPEQGIKKKRRRKKKKKIHHENNIAQDSEIKPSSTNEYLERPESLQEPSSLYISTTNEASKRGEFEKLFILEPRYLNSQLELKKIFGAKTINSGRTGKYGQRRVTRHCRLVSPKDHWTPTSGSGISMTFVSGNTGLNYFKFNHSEPYQEIQKKFMMAVDSLNPDNIVSLLTACPYHIDSRIQLSDLAKNAEDVQVAADLIEGAIHCMESSIDSRFSITNSLCRLEYKYQENRAFHILLFKHLLFVGQRACYRTALELCKRLLLLDADMDPLCVTLMIDFYALKSGEYQWFLNLYEFWESTRNLSQLPNWAYSIALGKFLLTKDSHKKQNRSNISKGQKISFSAAASASEKKLSEITTTTTDIVEINTNYGENKNNDGGGGSTFTSCDEYLQYAILMFPSVLLPLLDKCSVHCESRVLNHSYFNTDSRGNKKTSPLKLLCDLYVWRSHYLWKDKDIMAWVERNVYAVLDKIDRKDPIILDYEAKRRRRYNRTPRNILRHLILTDNKEHMGHLSAELSGEPILNYDPLPPTNAINIYETKRRLVGASGSGSGQSHGFLSGLFRSLLHDLNAPQPNEQELHRQLHGIEDGEIDEPGPSNPAQAGLHQSVTALLDSMRDLLSNLRPPGGGGGGVGQQENNDEDNIDEHDDGNID